LDRLFNGVITGFHGEQYLGENKEFGRGGRSSVLGRRQCGGSCLLRLNRRINNVQRLSLHNYAIVFLASNHPQQSLSSVGDNTEVKLTFTNCKTLEQIDTIRNELK
jgi:hypothetical protein